MNINIEQIKLKNFLSFGSKWQTVPFLPGLNVIIGEDLDTGRSNGAGKCVSFDTIIEIECSEKIKKCINKL